MLGAIWHPVVIALLPAVQMFVDGVTPVMLRSSVMAAALLSSAALILTGLGRMVMGCWRRAALVASLALFAGLNFMGIVVGVGMLLRFGRVTESFAFQGAVLGVLAALVLWAAWWLRTRDSVKVRGLTVVANVFATSMLFLLVITGVTDSLGTGDREWRAVAERLGAARDLQQPLVKEDRPDVFFLVLDGYGRADVLRRLYGFDNEPFLDELRRRGFHVVAQGRSNYQQTALSLASTFSLTYLDELARTMGPRSTDRRPLAYLAQHGAIVRTLKQAGYRHVAVLSPYFITRGAPLADQIIPPAHVPGDLARITWMSALRVLPPIQRWAYRQHASAALGAFEAVSRSATTAGPKFVFAHVLMPHPPFVLTAAGEFSPPATPYSINDGTHFPLSREEYVNGYREQVAFVNLKVLQVLDSILAASDRQPVVVIQGDHGPGGWTDWMHHDRSDQQERSGILAAYRFPNASRRLWDTATPINAWRVLLNEVVGTSLERVPDRSYYAPWERPYDLVEVDDAPLQAAAVPSR